MLAVTAVLPNSPTLRPPVVLVHGAANGASVWTFWQRELAAAGWPAYAFDLRGHGASPRMDLSDTSMRDYADDVETLVGQLAAPPIVMGWSMGGLVALMVAAAGSAQACVALAPSTPAQRTNPDALLRIGEFGPEEYGLTTRDPDGWRAMPDLDDEERGIALASVGKDSRFARDERRAGVVVTDLSCPLLIVTGGRDTQWPRSRYEGLWLKADFLASPEASHWGLVLNRRVLDTLVPAVLAWLERTTARD